MSDLSAARGVLLARTIADGLRLFAGPTMSRDTLAAAAGVDRRTVDGHCQGQSPPTVATLFRYFEVLPVEFAAHVLGRGAALAGVYRIDGEIAPGQALAGMTRSASALAAALADGRIDHVEARRLPADLRRFAAAAEQLAAELEAQA